MYEKLYRRLRVLLHRYPLLPFLLAASLAVDVLLMSIFEITSPSVVQRFLIGILCSQFCLIGIWVVHRLQNLSLRLGIAVACLLTLVLIFPDAEKRARLELSVIAVVLTSASALIYCLVNLIFRYRSIKNQIAHMRYGIKDLLILSTSTALLCYALTHVNSSGYELSLVLIAICVSFCATSLWMLNGLPGVAKRLLLPCLCFVTLCWSTELALFFINAKAITTNLSLLTQYALQAIGMHASLSIGVIASMLVWSYGLGVRRRPIRQRKKKQQATPNESEQPVVLKVGNQDEEPMEPPGPIDLTV